MVDNEPLYFLTIQSDRVGELRFELNGQTLTIVNEKIGKCENEKMGKCENEKMGKCENVNEKMGKCENVNEKIGKCENEKINNVPDSHHGSLRAPVLLRPAQSDSPYKIIENGHVIIIRDGGRYDVTGIKLQ